VILQPGMGDYIDRDCWADSNLQTLDYTTSMLQHTNK